MTPTITSFDYDMFINNYDKKYPRIITDENTITLMRITAYRNKLLHTMRDWNSMYKEFITDGSNTDNTHTRAGSLFNHLSSIEGIERLLLGLLTLGKDYYQKYQLYTYDNGDNNQFFLKSISGDHYIIASEFGVEDADIYNPGARVVTDINEILHLSFVNLVEDKNMLQRKMKQYSMNESIQEVLDILSPEYHIQPLYDMIQRWCDIDCDITQEINQWNKHYRNDMITVSVPEIKGAANLIHVLDMLKKACTWERCKSMYMELLPRVLVL
jgi:hypothetical protein